VSSSATGPTELPQILSELARVLTSQGHLLIGSFEGVPAEPLDHVVTKAYYRSVDEMSCLLQDAGFEVLDVETRQDPGSRPPRGPKVPLSGSCRRDDGREILPLWRCAGFHGPGP